jgi:hypothetical protein
MWRRVIGDSDLAAAVCRLTNPNKVYDKAHGLFRQEQNYKYL